MAEYIPPIQRLIEEFRRLPGVGAKTAARIILELKDKMSKEMLDDAIINAGTSDSAVSYMSNSAFSEASEALFGSFFTRSLKKLSDIKITPLKF